MAIWEVIGKTYSDEVFSAYIESELEPTEEQVDSILYNRFGLSSEYEIYGYVDWAINQFELEQLPSLKEVQSYRKATLKQQERNKNQLDNLDRYKL